jgi:autotransporter-associated beta strand protein
VIGGAFPLTKTGAGTLTLTNSNTYTGGTTISAGTLLVANVGGSGTGTGPVNNNGGTLGGTGAISGLLTNGSGSILMPGVGGIGKLTLSNNVTLLSGSTNTFVVNGSTGVASNSVVLGAAVTYGGVLNIVTNGTFTAGQTFTLFSGTGATNASNFASIVGSPGTGKAFSFANGVLSVVTTVLPKAVINSVTVNGSNLILQGTNGASSGTYSILTSTNLTLPLANWTTNSTGTFTAGGAFSNGVPITSQAQRFFLIKQP